MASRTGGLMTEQREQAMAVAKDNRKEAVAAADEYVMTPYGRKRRRGLRTLRAVLAMPFAGFYRRARGSSAIK